MRKSRLLFWIALFSLFTAVALALAAYRVFGDLAAGRHASPAPHFASELVGAYAAFALFPLVALAYRRIARLKSLLARGGLLVVATFGYSAAHTTILAFCHGVLFPRFGLPADSFLPRLADHAFQELGHDVLTVASFLAFFLLWDWGAALREREVRAAQLERALVDAQLRSLRLQLQPHFLFNALNTISSVMHVDLDAAERAIQHLAALLRAALRSSIEQVVPLREELDVLAHFVSLLEARFGERLKLRVEVAAGAERTPVPSLLLQPLVENVMRHGLAASSQPVHVQVRARLVAGALELEIEDDGPGSGGRADLMTRGVGLSSSAERLRLLYGAEARFDAGDRAEGGFRVQLRLPAGSPA